MNLWDHVLTPQVVSLCVAGAVLLTALIDWQFSQVKPLRSYANGRTNSQSDQTAKLRAGFSDFYKGYEHDRQRRNGWSGNVTEANVADLSAQARLENIRVESNRYLAQSTAKTSSSDTTKRPEHNLVTQHIPRRTRLHPNNLPK